MYWDLSDILPGFPIYCGFYPSCVIQKYTIVMKDHMKLGGGGLFRDLMPSPRITNTQLKL